MRRSASCSPCWRQDSLYVYSAPRTALKSPSSSRGDWKDAKALSGGDPAWITASLLTDAAGQRFPSYHRNQSLAAVEHDARAPSRHESGCRSGSIGSPGARQTPAGHSDYRFRPKTRQAARVCRRGAEIETDAKAQCLALREAIALIQLADPGDDVKLKGLAELRDAAHLRQLRLDQGDPGQGGEAEANRRPSRKAASAEPSRRSISTGPWSISSVRSFAASAPAASCWS